ncbi:hypothetical protein CS8_087110 [Cupriavidus sp. 8B]
MRIKNLIFDPDIPFARKVGVKAYPTTLFYDGSGRLVDIHVGLYSETSFVAQLKSVYPELFPQSGQ